MPETTTPQTTPTTPKKPISRGNAKKKTAKLIALGVTAAALIAGGIGLNRFLNTSVGSSEIFLIYLLSKCTKLVILF